MSDPFLAVAGALLMLSGLVLYLMRNLMARAGVDGWSWLPDGTQFKSYEYQLALSKAAAGIVAIAGLIFIAVFLWPR